MANRAFGFTGTLAASLLLVACAAKAPAPGSPPAPDTLVPVPAARVTVTEREAALDGTVGMPELRLLANDGHTEARTVQQVDSARE